MIFVSLITSAWFHYASLWKYKLATANLQIESILLSTGGQETESFPFLQTIPDTYNHSGQEYCDAMQLHKQIYVQTEIPLAACVLHYRSGLLKTTIRVTMEYY